MTKAARRPWNSLHAKLLATYLLLAALGTMLTGGYILWSFHNYFLQTRQEELEYWTSAVSESVEESLAAQDVQRTIVLVKRYGAPATITLRVFDSQGNLLATSDPEGDQRISDWRQIVGVSEGLRNQSSQGVTKGVLSTDDRLYISRPIQRDGQLLGVLRMSITLKQFQRQFINVFGTVVGSLIFTIVLCTVISDRFARSLSNPVEKMRNFAIRVGSGHFDEKLAIRQSNELDRLALELNRMSERLASLDQERRVFLANVSHELRTPISNVLVTVEALKNGAVEEPPLRDRFFQTIENEVKRLSRLIDDLLELGRLEAGVTPLEQQPIRVPYLIQRAVAALEPRAQAAEVVVQVEMVDLRIQGDPERLLQAILNILDNALKHSPAQSQILILGRKNGKWAEITIQDHGRGIQERDLPRIFEQFYTTDPSRKGRGVGLGLAIAKQIIDAHDGSITVSSKPGQGTAFVLRLPLDQKIMV